MINKLPLVLRSKVGLVVVGGVMVAAVGATAGLAVTGAMGHSLVAGQTPTPAQCASDDHTSGHTTSQSDDRDERDDQSDNQHVARGTITTVDTASSSFVLTQCNGTTTTVEVSTKTTFEGSSVHSLGDLKAGLFVDAEGTPQSNGRFSASSVHVEANSSDDDHDGSDSDDYHSGSGTSTPATGSGD
jgi:hypothetical protein